MLPQPCHPLPKALLLIHSMDVLQVAIYIERYLVHLLRVVCVSLSAFLLQRQVMTRPPLVQAQHLWIGLDWILI